MKLITTLLFLGLSCSVFGQGTQPPPTSGINTRFSLDVTNINTNILTGGDFFSGMLGSGSSTFEVPRGSGKNTIFAGALWLGGKDQQNNIYVESQTYRQFSPAQAGYWPGPIATTQNSAHNTKYDKVWKISKTQIQNHIANYTNPAYTMPADIASWPGNGNVANGEAAQLAPYLDRNNDGIYTPGQGDYPKILGDQALYLILNDKGNTKVPASPSMNAEIHVMYYGYNNPADTAIYNTIFSKYRIINRGTTNLKEMYAGLWIDFEIGFYNDDFVGCDTLNNRFYGYNGDNFDDLPFGYGAAPPVQSVAFLDKKMSHFLYFNNNNNAINGNPDHLNATHYYNYLTGKWKNNAPMTYGGDGTNPQNPNTSYMFPGNPVTQSGWSERNTLATPAVNTPADRRGIGSFGPFNLNAGQEINFTIAYNYSRGFSNLASIPFSASQVQKVQQFFNSTLLGTEKPEMEKQPLLLFPNPATDQLFIQLPADFENQPAEILISDYTGREVLRTNASAQTGKHYQLNISSLSKGIYQVSLTSGSQRVSARLVKM